MLMRAQARRKDNNNTQLWKQKTGDGASRVLHRPEGGERTKFNYLRKILIIHSPHGYTCRGEDFLRRQTSFKTCKVKMHSH